MMFKILLYLIICVVVGAAARNRIIGFWGGLVLSILLTPLLVALGLVLFNLNDSIFSRKA